MKQIFTAILLIALLPACSQADTKKIISSKMTSAAGSPDSLIRNYVDVMDFGVISGDTSADNSTAINKAIRYAHDHKILNVLLPSTCTAFVKRMIFIPFSNIHFYIEGTIMGGPGARDEWNGINRGVISAGKGALYYGATENTLKNIWILGGGTIDLRQVPKYWNAELYANTGKRQWMDASTVQMLQIENGKIQDLTILGSFASAIQVDNGRNVVVQRNNIKGLRPSKASPTMMYDGNLINITALDPVVSDGDSTYFCSVQVLYNILDGKNENSPYPFIMDGFTPDGANIGINIAGDPYTQGRGFVGDILIMGNSVKHCIWGIANEGQFASGTNSAIKIHGNFVSDCLLGVSSVTNTFAADNAHFISIRDNTIQNSLGDAIQCFGNHAEIMGNKIRNWGMAKKGNNMISLMQYNTNIGAAIHIVPFSQAAKQPYANGDILIASNTAYMNVKHDNDVYFSSISGIDIQLNHAGQVAQNIHITNNIINGGGSNVYHADNKRNAGLTLRGGMNNVKITGNTFTGFAGAGLTVMLPDASGSVKDAPNNVLVDGNSFIDNDVRPDYSNNSSIVLSGTLSGWQITNNYFQQRNRAINNVVTILPDFSRTGAPGSKVSDMIISNNRYEKTGFKNAPNVYDVKTSGNNIVVNDSLLK